MREIKFRSWDKEWKIMTAEVSFKDIQKGFTGLFGADKELMQSTDLQDRNGKEIFEGDYLEAKTNQGGFHRYEVRRVKGGLAINVFNDEFQKDFWTGWNAIADMQTSGFIEACCEVIGNKFEGMK